MRQTLFESLFWCSNDGSDVDDFFWIGSHFCFGCETSCLIFVIPFFFAWTVSFLGLQSAGCPSLVSLLYWFWLFGLFIYDFFFDNDCLSLWLFGTITVFCFWKNSFGAIHCALGSTERLPCPRLWLRVLIFENKTPASLALMGWRGIIILITPVFRNWNNACTSSAGSVQKHTVNCGIVFVILPQEV